MLRLTLHLNQNVKKLTVSHAELIAVIDSRISIYSNNTIVNLMTPVFI